MHGARHAAALEETRRAMKRPQRKSNRHPKVVHRGLAERRPPHCADHIFDESMQQEHVSNPAGGVVHRPVDLADGLIHQFWPWDRFQHDLCGGNDDHERGSATRQRKKVRCKLIGWSPPLDLVRRVGHVRT